MNNIHPMTNHRFSQRRRSHESLAQASWATSLGDLVTLLVCFFLTMISFGPKAERVSDDPAPPTEESGISLALEGRGVTERTFRVPEEELLRVAYGGQSEAVGKAKDVLLTEGYARKRVTVTVLPAGHEVNPGAGWMSIIQPLSGIHRQLLDAAPEAEFRFAITASDADDGQSSATIIVEDLGK